MFLSLSSKNLFFDNNYSHFSKQECVTVALLAFFILCLPFFSIIPYTRATIALLSFLLLARSLASPKQRIVLSAETILFLLYLATVLSGVFKKNAHVSSLLAFFIVLSGFLPTLAGLSRDGFCRILCLCGAICGAHALAEYGSGGALALWTDTERFGNLARVGSFFGNPNLLGAFMSVCVILSFDKLYRTLKTGGWSLYGVSLFLSFAALILSYSRGAWLGTLIGFGFYFFRLWEERSPDKYISYALFPFSSVLSRAQSLFSADSSVCYRFSLWKSILRVPIPQLLFGVGEGKTALLSLLSPHMSAGLEKIEHTHSLFFSRSLCRGDRWTLAFFGISVYAS